MAVAVTVAVAVGTGGIGRWSRSSFSPRAPRSVHAHACASSGATWGSTTMGCATTRTPRARRGRARCCAAPPATSGATAPLARSVRPTSPCCGRTLASPRTAAPPTRGCAHTWASWCLRATARWSWAARHGRGLRARRASLKPYAAPSPHPFPAQIEPALPAPSRHPLRTSLRMFSAPSQQVLLFDDSFEHEVCTATIGTLRRPSFDPGPCQHHTNRQALHKPRVVWGQPQPLSHSAALLVCPCRVAIG